MGERQTPRVPGPAHEGHVMPLIALVDSRLAGQALGCSAGSGRWIFRDNTVLDIAAHSEPEIKR